MYPVYRSGGGKESGFRRSGSHKHFQEITWKHRGQQQPRKRSYRPWGSNPTAASGGGREESEWQRPRCPALPVADEAGHKRVQRSADDEDACHRGRCRAPQTDEKSRESVSSKILSDTATGGAKRLRYTTCRSRLLP